VKRAEKKLTVDFLEALVNALENQIDIRTALELSLSSVPKRFREKAKAVLRAYKTGRSLYDSFILAGFPKEYFYVLRSFEEEGNVAQGLKAVKEFIETDIKLDSSMFSIDIEVLVMGIFLFITAVFIIGYYMPTMAKLISNITDNPRRLGGVSQFIYTHFKGKTVGDALKNPLLIIATVVFFFLWKTRLYRGLLKVFPQYKKLQKLADKISLTTAFALSKNYAQTLSAIVESFGNKYRLKEVYRRFRLGAGFEAFAISDIFDSEEEKRLFILAGNNNFPAIFNYLRRSYEKQRENAFTTLSTIMRFLIIGLIIALIVALVVISMAPMKEMMSSIG